MEVVLDAPREVRVVGVLARQLSSFIIILNIFIYNHHVEVVLDAPREVRVVGVLARQLSSFIIILNIFYL